ncbi:MAG: choice-of-anchor B family protein [Planctomycetota bacterium]
MDLRLMASDMKLPLVLAAFSVASSVAAHPTLERVRMMGTQAANSSDDFESSGMSLLLHLPLNEFPSNPSDAQDCWGYASASGREYALVCLSNALAVVEVTIPSEPDIIASFPTDPIPWHDVKTIGDHAYVVSEGSDVGLLVLDLSQVDEGIVTEVNRVFTGGVPQSHNIVANEDTGFLYRVGGGFNVGLRAYATGKPDALGNPTPGSPDNPVFVGTLNNLYVHDAQVVTWDRPGPQQGREIAFACSGEGIGTGQTALRIYDITDKNNVVLLNTIFYGSSAYSHQGWLSDDRRYFYLNDELDEQSGLLFTATRIFDLDPSGTGNLEDAVYDRINTNFEVATDHNLYIRDGLMFASNYSSGLRIFDVQTAPRFPEEIAFFDTVPGSGNVSFIGSWSNYPYLPSGNILLSDLGSGLLVLRLDINDIIIKNQFSANLLDPQGGSLLAASFQGVFESELDPNSVKLRVRDEGGSVATFNGFVVGVDQGADIFEFEVGPLDCGTIAEYWFEADTASGFTVTEPGNAPDETFAIAVATDNETIFENSGTSAAGFSVSGMVDDGEWESGVPVNGERGDPPADFDGDGFAWLTDNVAGNSDVDEGVTTLTFPVIDASGGGALRWAYWLNDIANGPLGPEDFLSVEIATDPAGLDWQVVRTYNAALASWREDFLFVGPGQAVGATETLRLRFSVADLSPGNVVEAAIDAVSFGALLCEDSACNNPADTDGDGSLTAADFGAWLSAFLDNDPIADQNSDGVIAGDDFAAWLGNFVSGVCS